MGRLASPDEEGCRAEGCGRRIEVKKHRLCSRHYQAFWRYGDPLGSPNKRKTAPCSAPGCDRIGSGTSGLCHKHYLRLKRTGRLDLSVQIQKRCSEAGCSDLVSAQGLCQRHYDRQRGAFRRPTRVCGEAGCGNPTKARGLCKNHYEQLSRRGALHTAPLRSTTAKSRHRQCRGCGADLTELSRGRRYCSEGCKPRCTGPSCNRKAIGRGLCSQHLKQTNAGKSLVPIGERVERASNDPCGWCGNPVGVDSTAMFCSAVCRGLNRRHRSAVKAGNCAQCGVHIDYLAPASGKSKRLTPVSKRLCDECRHRSPSLYLSADEIRKRDGDLCRLCGLPVPSTARKPHPLSAEVDHLVPISMGGTHDPENLALTHKTCNIAKGGRPATWRRDPAEVAPLLNEWRRTGSTAEPPKTCSVVDCERRPDSHGMCQKHRRRVMKYGTVELPSRPTICVVEDCNESVRAKGRCSSHYRKYLAGDRLCCKPDCSRPVHTRQLCRRHYQLWLDNRPA